MLPGFISGGFFGATVSELLNTGTVSGGAITFTGLDLSPYYEVRVYLSGVAVNTDDYSVVVQLELGGSLVTSSSYESARSHRTSGVGGEAEAGGTEAYIVLDSLATSRGIGNAAGESLSGWFAIGNPVSTKNKSIYGFSTWRYSSGAGVSGFFAGMLANTGNVTGFKIYCPDASGSLTAGRAFLMGLS